MNASIRAHHRLVWWALRPLFIWRLLRLLARAFWLAAALSLGGWLGASALGRSASFWDAAAVGGLLLIALFSLLALWPVRFPRLIYRLDLGLGLGDRLIAASEVAHSGPQNYLEARLLQAVARWLAEARRQFWRTPAVPWGDLELCLLVGVVGWALAGQVGVSTPGLPATNYLPLPPLGAEAVVPLPGLPPELNAGLTPFATPEETAGETLGLNPVEAQQAMDALTQALAEQSLTQSAAAALAQNQPGQAANDLRQLADAAATLDPESKWALGESLRDAAAQTWEAAPPASEELAKAARGLQGEGSTAAAEAMESLARLIEDLSDALARDRSSAEGASTSGEDGSGSGLGLGATAGRESKAERLAAEGEDVLLPGSEEPTEETGVFQPPTHDRPSGGQASAPYAQTVSVGGRVEALSDPLSYPWRFRRVVQGYFSTP